MKKVIISALFSVVLLVFTACNNNSSVKEKDIINTPLQQQEQVQVNNQTIKQTNDKIEEKRINDEPFREINGNSMNGSIVTRNEDYLFFIDRSGGKTFKMKLDGSDLKSISDISAEYMNVSQDYLYYYNPSEKSIQKMNIDGKNVKTLLKINGDSLSWLRVADGVIYFNVDGQLNKLDMKGKQSTIGLSGKVFYMNLVGNKLYYSEFDSKSKLSRICLFDLVTQEKKIIKEGVRNDLMGFVVNNGWIYYLVRENNSQNSAVQNPIYISDTHSTIYRISIDGKEEQEINSYNCNIHSINVKDQWVYYTKEDKEYYEVIGRTSTNGDKKEEILPFDTTYRLDYSNDLESAYTWNRVGEVDRPPYDSPISLNIAEDWLYYENVYGHNAYLQRIKVN